MQLGNRMLVDVDAACDVLSRPDGVTIDVVSAETGLTESAIRRAIREGWMPYSMPSMDMLRRFVGEDPEADTQVLELCLNAAQQWYEKAGVPAQETDLYRFWVCNLAAWYYDNRGAGGSDANVPPYVVASLHQLRPRKAR